MLRSIQLAVVCFAVLVATAGQVRAGVLVAQDRGWFNSQGTHSVTNKNTYTGLFTSSDNPYRSFFVFDPSTLSGVAVSAVLQLELESYFGNDPFEVVDIFSVSTSPSALATNYASGSPIGQGIYEDLGTGSLYGSFTARPSDVGTVFGTTLSSQAVADLNNAINSGTGFSVGLRIREPFSSTADEALRFSSGSEARTHQLVVTTRLGPEPSAVPEPSTLVLFGLGACIAGIGAAHRRRREQKRESVIQSCG